MPQDLLNNTTNGFVLPGMKPIKCNEIPAYSGIFSVEFGRLPRAAGSRSHIDGFMQERPNSSALAMQLRISCTNPSIWNISLIHILTNWIRCHVTPSERVLHWQSLIYFSLICASHRRQRFHIQLNSFVYVSSYTQCISVQLCTIVLELSWKKCLILQILSWSNMPSLLCVRPSGIERVLGKISLCLT